MSEIQLGQREAFEKWANCNNYYTGNEEGYYFHDETIHAWNAWQASNAQFQELIAELLEALNQVSEAYCGVGDFEGTGENMATVIVQVREAMQKAKQRLKESE